MKETKRQKPLQVFVGTAMIGALAFVLMLLEFPLLPSAPYLKMDFGDLPCLFAALLWGPGYGVITELVKNALELLVRGFGSQMGFGNLQNFLIGCAYVLPFSLLLRHSKRDEQKKLLPLLAGSGIGLVIVVIVGFFSNWVIAPLFFRFFLNNPLTGEAALAAAWVSVPFNAIKALLISLIAILLYRPFFLTVRKLGNGIAA